MKVLEFHTAADICSSRAEANSIMQCGILNPQNHRHVLYQASIISLLIHTSDVLQKCAKYADRVDFSDHIAHKSKLKVKDVTDLICAGRNAVCHVSSDTHFIDRTQGFKASFTTIIGKADAFSIDGLTVQSEFEDDMALCFGVAVIYLQRHVARSLQDASKKLEPLMPKMFQNR